MNPGTPSQPPTGVAATQVGDPLNAAFKWIHQQEPESQAELELKCTPIWNADIQQGNVPIKCTLIWNRMSQQAT